MDKDIRDMNIVNGTMKVHSCVKLMCAERGITLQELAERAGFNVQTLVNWKNNEPQAFQIVRKIDAVFNKMDVEDAKKI